MAKYRREGAGIYQRFTKRESSAIALHGDLQVTALLKNTRPLYVRFFTGRVQGEESIRQGYYNITKIRIRTEDTNIIGRPHA